jgi:ubiquinone/menaquinone biosynthesis C-methylase UbiE
VALAREAYRDLAGEYDFRSWAGTPYRRLIVARLGLKRGEVVLDVGCGTGLAFAPVEEKIGRGGRLLCLDVCPEMLARARARAKREGWRNVTLIESSAEEAEIPEQADAVLFSAAHDILRSPGALENVLRQVRAGARVVAGGPKWAPWWAPWGPWLNACTWEVNRPYVTTWEGFSRPWSVLERFIPDLNVEAIFLGAGYIATGTLARG